MNKLAKKALAICLAFCCAFVMLAVFTPEEAHAASGDIVLCQVSPGKGTIKLSNSSGTVLGTSNSTDPYTVPASSLTEGSTYTITLVPDSNYTVDRVLAWYSISRYSSEYIPLTKTNDTTYKITYAKKANSIYISADFVGVSGSGTSESAKYEVLGIISDKTAEGHTSSSVTIPRASGGTTYFGFTAPDDGWISFNTGKGNGATLVSPSSVTKLDGTTVSANTAIADNARFKVTKGTTYTFKKYLDAAISLTVTCHRCSPADQLSYTQINNNATNHTLITTNKCSACGDVKSQNSSSEAHTWGSPVKTEATCTSNATNTYTCTKCGYKKVEEISGTKLEHTYSSVSKYNETQHKCTCTCGTSITESHTFSGNVCSKCGYDKTVPSSSSGSGSSSSSGSDTSYGGFGVGDGKDGNGGYYGYDGYDQATQRYWYKAQKPSRYYVTKLNANTVNITIQLANRDVNDFHNGITVQVYAGKKKIKEFDGTKYTTIMFKYKKKGAGKKSYTVKVIQKYNKSTAKVTKKPKANKVKTLKCTWSKEASSYGYMANTWRPSSVSARGNTVTCKGFFINNHILDLGYIKYKVSVYYVDAIGGRKLLKTKTLSSGKINDQSIKSTSFSFTCKKLKDYDFKNGGRFEVQYSLVGWHY